MNARRTTKKNRDKLNLLSSIYVAANEYKNNMVGNVFLYVFDNRYIEVCFKKSNFKHLTGVDSNLSPDSFYKNSIKNTLSINQFFFSSRHPYILAKKKLEHLKNLFQMSSSECFIQEDIVTGTAVYKFSTTDLEFSLMLSEDFDTTQNTKKSDYYVVKSLRDRDVFDKSRSIYEVTYIFEKKNNESKYDKMLFSDNKNSNIPEEVKSKLSSILLSIIS